MIRFPALGAAAATVLLASCGQSSLIGTAVAPDPADPLAVTDYEGNSYRIVSIGEQVWMAENLNIRHFRNGDPISEAVSGEEWTRAREDGEPAWSHYDNDPTFGALYGKLYSREAIDDPRSLCPEGWRLPSEQDWRRLAIELGMSEDEAEEYGWRGSVAGKLKSTRTEPDPHPRWDAPNTPATNESGFSALPAGYRTGRPNYAEQQVNTFRMLGGEAVFWSAEGGAHAQWSDRAGIFRGSRKIAEGFGFSIRCIRVNPE